MSNTELDMITRMTPSPAQLLTAAKLYADNPGAYAVVVPIAFPDKRHGIWTLGQQVEHPAGAFLALTQGGERAHNYGYARNAAEGRAMDHLTDVYSNGVAGYVVIDADGTWSVFEGMSV